MSNSHLVLIPSYNTGPILFETLRGVCTAWNPVWVVFDGSDDGTFEELTHRQSEFLGLRLLHLPQNCGKGSAVLHGIKQAAQEGFTHALIMDSDGQHPPSYIARYMDTSQANPAALILGKPVFDDSAPWERVLFRKACNWWTNIETLWAGIGDSLFGMRVYPIHLLVDVMAAGKWGRRFDFDAETAIRLCWTGVKPINIPTPVRYPTRAEGGISHFNYIRDNILLCWMHWRLFWGFIVRLPLLIKSSRH